MNSLRMKPSILGRLIGNKPDTFTGTKREWGKLVVSLLTPPDPSKTWIKTPNGEWVREKV